MANRKYTFNLPVSESRLSAISALVTSEAGAAEVRPVPIKAIQPNPFQPRNSSSQDELSDLSASIRRHGILQPLIGRPESDGSFTLIAGHRRWKAAEMAGNQTVPMVLREKATDDDLRLLALVENLQREDLHPVAKARALADLAGRFRTQQEAAEALGMKQDALAHWLRVRQLGDEVLGLCAQIPHLSLRRLLRLVKLPAHYRLREAKRWLVLSQRSEEPSPKKTVPAKKRNVHHFTVQHSTKELTFTIEVRSRARKQIITRDDYRDALLQALAALDSEREPQN